MGHGLGRVAPNSTKVPHEAGDDADDFLRTVPEASPQGIPGGPAAGTRCSHCQGAGSALAGELRGCEPQGGAKGKVKRDEHADSLEDGFFAFDLTGIADF